MPYASRKEAAALSRRLRGTAYRALLSQVASSRKSCRFCGSNLLLKAKEHLVPIRPYLKEGAFGPDVVSAMAAAFEDVRSALANSGRSDITIEMIAAKIIELARGGEIDPVVLREMTLSELGLSRLSKGP